MAALAVVALALVVMHGLGTHGTESGPAHPVAHPVAHVAADHEPAPAGTTSTAVPASPDGTAWVAMCLAVLLLLAGGVRPRGARPLSLLGARVRPALPVGLPLDRPWVVPRLHLRLSVQRC
ncbi:hypothetical protein [Nocardioides donggukensis]|uniref:Uncharacterized protein n=1 Tax=Nocardioides donggukensis TaxID=2774019 RepID=A0A927K7F9_9ACTN|nr:hypothetical protein [Nocardioides donggukensis]MBD8870398.1 hypothetical protein [Nocardioides donggukensis]